MKRGLGGDWSRGKGPGLFPLLPLAAIRSSGWEPSWEALGKVSVLSHGEQSAGGKLLDEPLNKCQWG